MVFKTKALRLFITLFFSIFISTSYAQEPSTINGQFSSSLFKKGATWTWSYYESGDLNKLYSEEKYKVIKKKGQLITFVLSSKVGQETNFSKRHKFRVDLRVCNQKWKRRNYNPSLVKRFWQRVNQSWKLVENSGKSLLFEEKFNCNPKLKSNVSFYSHPWFGENFVVGPSKEGSFYFREGPMKGILSHKFFNKGTPHFYLLVLKEKSN